MKFDLAVISWQSVASLLTFVAVAIALWSVNVQRREAREPLNNSAQAWMGRVVPFFGDVQASL